MDYIVIHMVEEEGHDFLQETVLKIFKGKGLKINSKKIQYRMNEVELLGVAIDGKNKKLLEITRNEALEYRRPENIKELRRLLKLARWFRAFIKDFSRMLQHLRNT